MLALQCRELGSINQLVLGEMEDPVPGPGEVLISCRAAGVNFPDLLKIEGKYQVKPSMPFVPGCECSGYVEALGDGVDHVQVGDAVMAMGSTGAFAEKMIADARGVSRMPEGLSFETAAAVSITYGTSYYALKQKARLSHGETLVVLGAGGGVGTAAVELGKQMGAKVIAVAGSEQKLDVACEMGADLRINYATEPFKQRIKELTEGRGADVVYDPVGGEYTEQAFRAMAWDGRYLVVGFASGEIPKIPLNLALLKGADICGVFWGAWWRKDPEGSAQNVAELSRMLTSGDLKPKITTYPLDEYRIALKALEERRAIGKVVLTIRD